MAVRGKKKRKPVLVEKIESWEKRLLPDVARGTSLGATLTAEALTKRFAWMLGTMVARGSLTEKDVERIIAAEYPDTFID